jgi:peptidoglycan/LPS O-acetylase OafA/YrhL
VFRRGAAQIGATLTAMYFRNSGGADRVAGHRGSEALAVGETVLSGAAPTPNGPNELRYLPFVDGLRAISILAVVAFHIGVPGIPGGFVGVDVFFVISGFLIINQIKAGLTSGRFSSLSFYVHRALRILPPYVIMLTVTYVVALFVLPTTAVYWDFLASAITAPLMVSNVLFYLSQGYFDISAIEKPLLHTWTLSVEEQFYLVAPLLLMLVFRLGNRRFGAAAVLIGLVLGAVSLTGAIVKTSTTEPNAAFYLSYWRAWEFLAGGFIGASLVAAVKRLPFMVVEGVGLIGLGCIALAIGTFNAGMPYPSANAAVPVAGAALIILCGQARPEIIVARLLSLRWIVGIGLVSYSWYLWHWPILSFIRIVRLDQPSLLIDGLGAGLLAFLLACLCYRYVEAPIRRWRKTPGNLQYPARIFAGALAACLLTALIGAGSALAGYWSTASLLASRYGIQEEPDPGCESKLGFAESCFHGRVGMLVGDSHATVLFGPFARKFDALGVRLVSMARGSCGPLMLAPSQRAPNRHDGCARLISPYERLLARPDPIGFAIITGNWSDDPAAADALSAMLSEFDRRTRILLIGPVPTFLRPSLECVVLSDRYGGGRDRCVRPRQEVEAEHSGIVAVLQAMPDKFPNVRYIDPTGVFCDQTTCRPFGNNTVYYVDSHHLSPTGADLLYESFKPDFLWLDGVSG